MTTRILTGDVREVLPMLEAGSVQCCVTSPPYFGLRSYLPDGHPDKCKEIGQESAPDQYVATMVAVFREVWRALRDDGTLWLNLGDSYAGGGNGGVGSFAGDGIRAAEPGTDKNKAIRLGRRGSGDGVKPKDMLGIPWMVAFALRADGWYLRRDIIWAKPNPMPESVTDRPTSAHEYVFLLSKSPKYFYDADAIREPASDTFVEEVNQGYSGSDTKDYAAAAAQSPSGTKARIIASARKRVDKQRGHGRRHAGFNDRWDAMTREEQLACGSNRRSVWTIPPAPFRGAHFATMPPALAELCILAGSRPGDMVLDPFGGAGTTALVADRLKRNATLIELNPDNPAMAAARIKADGGLFAEIAA